MRKMYYFLVLFSLIHCSCGYISLNNRISLHRLRSSGPKNDISDLLLQKFHEIDIKTGDKINSVVDLFKKEKVDYCTFSGTTGYGHGDYGREKFNAIVAQLMGAESAIASIHFFSGTHAIACALFGCLRPGNKLLTVSGHPYDTLEEVIGLRNEKSHLCGSLKDWNIGFVKNDPIVVQDGEFARAEIDLTAMDKCIQSDPSIKAVHIQRSCGYQWRPSINITEIQRCCEYVKTSYKDKGRDIIVFVDNCYGELVEDVEPCHVGADIVAGSLIKNLGGTLAPCGGYVAGKYHLVDAARSRLCAPGVEGGATLDTLRLLYQGLFLSSSIVGESLKGAEYLSYTLTHNYGYECLPAPFQHRTDIIQAIKLKTRENLVNFCETVQSNSPVGSFIKPIPGSTSGYGDEVIFADGTFIEGSTLELSADGPLRPPFVAFTQGCTHWTHWRNILRNINIPKH